MSNLSLVGAAINLLLIYQRSEIFGWFQRVGMIDLFTGTYAQPNMFQQENEQVATWDNIWDNIWWSNYQLGKNFIKNMILS